MMNTKEKAIDLIKKFDVKYHYKFTKGSFPVSMHNSVIKQCVINAIDEILSLMINDFKWDMKYNGNVDYWIEVKEIVETEFDKLYNINENSAT